MTHISEFLVLHGALVLFLIAFAEQSGLPFPGAPWLLAAGAIAAGGRINLFTAISWPPPALSQRIRSGFTREIGARLVSSDFFRIGTPFGTLSPEKPTQA